MRLFRSIPLAVALLLAACSGTRPVTSPADLVGFTVLSDSLPPDPAMLALVEPYAEALREQTAEIVGRTEVEITKGRPEGALGTFAAEAMLWRIQGLTDSPVQIALTNNGGLRVPLGPGPITVGKMFELMPFENMMIVLDLSGAQLDSLAQQLARTGGDPIAGFSFTVRDGEATGIRVEDQALSNDRIYRLVTSDYLANGGGPYSILWDDSIGREELTYLLRDAFIEHLREIGTIEPRLPGLIRIEH